MTESMRVVGPVPVNGTELHVQELGEGPAILFIHGMCGNADAWSDQAGRLSDGFRCVAYDRRGHTRSPFGDDRVQASVGLHADDAATMIDALGLAPVLIVGSSGGARIGVDVCRRYPELLRGAVLSEPAIIGLSDDGGAAFRDALGPLLSAAATPQDAVDAFFGVVDPDLWGSLPQSRKDAFRANHVELFRDLAMPPYLPSADELERIEVPLRLLNGSRSVAIFGEIVRRIGAAVPGAEIVVLEGATHATYATRPEAFADAVRSFAREHP